MEQNVKNKKLFISEGSSPPDSPSQKVPTTPTKPSVCSYLSIPDGAAQTPKSNCCRMLRNEKIYQCKMSASPWRKEATLTLNKRVNNR